MRQLFLKTRFFKLKLATFVRYAVLPNASYAGLHYPRQYADTILSTDFPIPNLNTITLSFTHLTSIT